MPQLSGRERRRKGLVNRTRRALYGVMLWLGAVHTAAAGDDGGTRFHTQQSPAVAARNVAVVQIHAPGLAGLLHSDFMIPANAIPQPGQPLIADYGTTRLIALDIDSRVLGALRDGVA